MVEGYSNGQQTKEEFPSCFYDGSNRFSGYIVLAVAHRVFVLCDLEFVLV